MAQVFSCTFRKISKNTFFTEHVWAFASGIHKYGCQILKIICKENDLVNISIGYLQLS